MHPFTDIYNFLVLHLTKEVAIAVTITIIAGYVKSTINKYIISTEERLNKMQEKLALTEKRLSKVMGIMFLCPSVSERNKWWLKDDKINTSPPDASLCSKPRDRVPHQ